MHTHLGTVGQGGEFFRRWEAGEISYQELCELDASLWRGVARERMLEALASNPIRDGARELIAWFKARGVPCIGVSTGLSVFNEVTADEFGLDEVICNELCFEDGICTGAIRIHVSEHSKGEVFTRICEVRNCDPGCAIAFGDGPADVAMFELAGCGVAVFPRVPAVLEAADFVLRREPIDTICAEIAKLADER